MTTYNSFGSGIGKFFTLGIAAATLLGLMYANAIFGGKSPNMPVAQPQVQLQEKTVDTEALRQAFGTIGDQDPVPTAQPEPFPFPQEDKTAPGPDVDTDDEKSPENCELYGPGLQSIVDQHLPDVPAERQRTNLITILQSTTLGPSFGEGMKKSVFPVYKNGIPLVDTAGHEYIVLRFTGDPAVFSDIKSKFLEEAGDFNLIKKYSPQNLLETCFLAGPQTTYPGWQPTITLNEKSPAYSGNVYYILTQRVNLGIEEVLAAQGASGIEIPKLKDEIYGMVDRLGNMIDDTGRGPDSLPGNLQYGYDIKSLRTVFLDTGLVGPEDPDYELFIMEDFGLSYLLELAEAAAQQGNIVTPFQLISRTDRHDNFNEYEILEQNVVTY